MLTEKAIVESLRHPENFYFVIDRLPSPEELRYAEDHGRMLLNVVPFQGFDPSPLDRPAWLDRYLLKGGLWESDYMSIRFAMPGENTAEVAVKWANELDSSPQPSLEDHQFHGLIGSRNLSNRELEFTF